MNEGAQHEDATTQAQASVDAGSGIVPAAAREQIPGGPLLVAAYGLMWLLLFLYLVWLRRHQARLQAEVGALQDRLDMVVGQFEARRDGGAQR